MQNQSTHLLIVEDEKGRRVFTLEDPLYSIGRNPDVDIRLFSQFVSRRHATLVRREREDGSSYYRIIDGTLKGKLSAKGLVINGHKLQSHDLEDEDEILFGSQVSAKYYIVKKEERAGVKYKTKKTKSTVPPPSPKLGGLYVQSEKGNPLVFPLKHTDVQAKVTGNVSRVEVTQTFENPFSTPLEATYIFPLPDEAAVDDMEIRIGDRIIKGNIKKRQEAVAIYEQAKNQGRTAGLLEQERANIFTQSLANIQPGEQIDVIIRYTDSLKFTGGNYEFVFPMVVGPRYIPGTTIDENTTGGGSAPAPMTLNKDTDLVPDASRLNAPILPPGTRSGYDINVTVDIEAGVEIKEVHSPSHQIQIERQEQRMGVTLSQRDTIPNKDLILRYQVAGDRTQTTVLSQIDNRGGHFAVYLIPAIEYHPDQLVPKDVVFLIDTSGSQSGEPLNKCQELMRRFIQGLNPHDTFTIIDFSDTTRQLSPVPLTNTEQNRNRAMKYINQLNASGGTQLMRGIQAVLNFPEVDPGRLRSIVLLTDGYIGNENQILAEVQRHLKLGNRLHSFGAGSSVNRFLLNRIAEIGRGISRIVRYDEPTEELAEQFFGQINNPVLTNIHLYWQGEGEPPIIYPATPPDLFAEQPLVLFGRQKDARPGQLEVTGTIAGGQQYKQSFELNFEDTGNPAIAQLWGRNRIKDLMNQMVKGETKVGVETVTDTALIYQLLCQYTAFIAVSDEVRVNPNDRSVSVQVPVEMPEGISYQGIFGDVEVEATYEFEQIPSEPPDEFDITLIDFDLTLIDPSMLGYEDEEIGGTPTPEPAPSKTPDTEPIFKAPLRKAPSTPNRLQVVSATGLNKDAIADLTQHLQSIPLSPGVKGNLVFEFYISQGRVRQLILDQEASSVNDQDVTEAIRRSLLTCYLPQAVVDQVRLVIGIKP